MTTGCLIVSGHLVDGPDRPVPRFPQSAVPAVARSLNAVFDEWGVGPGWLVLCGGARGADTIGAEAGLARNASVLLCLAEPPVQFAASSVDLPGTDWAARFSALLGAAEVRVLPPGDRAGPERYSRTNEWMVRLARERTAQPYAVVVWDGRAGDGVGGTADLVCRLGYGADDPRLRIIPPTGR